ncbi:MAG: hypothetical protein WB770_09765, partial [Acidimicrobiales bacterium]
MLRVERSFWNETPTRLETGTRRTLGCDTVSATASAMNADFGSDLGGMTILLARNELLVPWSLDGGALSSGSGAGDMSNAVESKPCAGLIGRKVGGV